MQSHFLWQEVRIIAILLKDLSLKDITPPSILHDLNIQALIYALDPEFRQITKDIKQVALLPRIDELDEDILAHLAWQYHADFYDLAETIGMKREVVKNSLKLHMKKGTVWAIKEALRQLGIEAEYIPWWENGGEPYTFSLVANVTGDFYRTEGRDALMSNILRAVDEAKSARSYMSGLVTGIHDTQQMQLYSGVFPLISGEIYIRPYHPPMTLQTEIFSGVGMSLHWEETVSLPREKELHAKIYSGVAVYQWTDLEIGVDLDTMHELLLQFEKRIFDRLDENEQTLADMITQHQEKLQQIISQYDVHVIERLERIEKLLTWNNQEGDDNNG